MSYILLNIDKNIGFICHDTLWTRALSLAKDNYWEPEGTFYNFEENLNEFIDDCDDELHILFSSIIVRNEYYQWDGNYLEKKGQIVSETDSYYLYEALQDTDIDKNLIKFIEMGSFKIISKY